jgi:hypothetical protein
VSGEAKLCTECRHNWGEVPAPPTVWNRGVHLTFCDLKPHARGPEARKACQGKLWESKW